MVFIPIIAGFQSGWHLVHGRTDRLNHYWINQPGEECRVAKVRIVNRKHHLAIIKPFDVPEYFFDFVVTQDFFQIRRQ